MSCDVTRRPPQGRREFKWHRDDSLVSCVLTLGGEWEGGGFEFKPLGDPGFRPVWERLPVGDLLLMDGRIEHCARPVTQGERWMLVIFFGRNLTSVDQWRYADD